MRRKTLRLVAVGLVAFAALLYALLPGGPRDPMPFDDPWHRPREVVRTRAFVAVAGTPWATQAMLEILERGGNAFDAAVAGLLVLNVTFGEAASFPGIAPLLVWDAKRGQARSYLGVGTAPARASIEEFRRRGHEVVPKYDVLAQLVPASPDVIVELLREYGSRGFAELSAEAIRLAEEGFPVHRIMARNLDLSLFERLGLSFLMPYNARVYGGGEWWRPIHYGDRFVRPDLAATLRALGRAESDCLEQGGARRKCLQAVRDYFYRGPIADAIVALHEAEDGLITREDLAGYAGGWETPLRGRFRGYEVLTNGTWTQGIVVPLALQIVEPLPLESFGRDSPAYVHAVVQAIELAMADREAYVGDPAFVGVPAARLLSREHATRRRGAMTRRAFGRMPEPGALAGGARRARQLPRNGAAPSVAPRLGRDTSYLAVIDRAGNSVSLTPSDFPESPMVPGTGLTLGIRMTQFRLDAESPTALAPGKRPRVTPHALMLLRDGRHVMSLGTPGDEMQTQANVQVLLNHLVFGMGLQEAIDAPRFRSLDWPDSFAPHAYEPGVLELEQGLYEAVGAEMEALGYRVRAWPDWDNHFGGVGAVRRADGALLAGADPREGTVAAGR
jgi:gamma-glutamyltranspeptidase/glutathione hydrolase